MKIQNELAIIIKFHIVIRIQMKKTKKKKKIIYARMKKINRVIKVIKISANKKNYLKIMRIFLRIKKKIYQMR